MPISHLNPYKIYYTYRYRQFKNRIKRLLGIKKKKDNRFVQIDFPTDVELVLSVACQASCIYCPPRGQSTKEKFMSVDLVKKILRETKGEEVSFSLSQNGEALLNPNFLQIFKLIREQHPDSYIKLFTNLDRLTARMSKEILDIGLDELHFNIDGSTAQTYEKVKGLDFEKIKKNLWDFLNLRIFYQTRMILQVITFKRYEKFFKRPCKLKDDTFDVLKFWCPHLRNNDRVVIPFIYSWNENISGDGDCTLYNDLLTHIYINSDGRVYPCCVMPDVNICLGNLRTQTIQEVWHSEKRKSFVKDVANRKYPEHCKSCNNKL